VYSCSSPLYRRHDSCACILYSGKMRVRTIFGLLQDAGRHQRLLFPVKSEQVGCLFQVGHVNSNNNNNTTVVSLRQIRHKSFGKEAMRFYNGVPSAIAEISDARPTCHVIGPPRGSASSCFCLYTPWFMRLSSRAQEGLFEKVNDTKCCASCTSVNIALVQGRRNRIVFATPTIQHQVARQRPSFTLNKMPIIINNTSLRAA
jgi:hypothetical protein